jgi:hypothetical protein
MFHPPIRVVVSFALPLIAAGGITAVGLSTREAAPDEVIDLPVVGVEQDGVADIEIGEPDVPEAVPDDPPDQLTPEQFSFVIRVAGKSYIRIGEDDVVPHARPKLISEDGAQTAIAPVTLDELPEHLRDWNDRVVSVEGKCRAHVVGFAVLAQLTGDPGYAGDDKPWSAASVMEHGAPRIVAKLDGCAGTWVRAEGQSPAVVGVEATSGPLVAAARVDLFAGELAKQTQDEWRAAKLEGDWRTEVPITALVARHPVTNERWIVLHAKRGGGCGDHEVNILAAYRANDDGTVTRVHAQTVDLDSIQQLVDVDGDGTFEVIGTQTWGLNRTFIDLHGNSLSTLPLQFYGCPC